MKSKDSKAPEAPESGAAKVSGLHFAHRRVNRIRVSDRLAGDAAGITDAELSPQPECAEDSGVGLEGGARASLDPLNDRDRNAGSIRNDAEREPAPAPLVADD